MRADLQMAAKELARMDSPSRKVLKGKLEDRADWPERIINSIARTAVSIYNGRYQHDREWDGLYQFTGNRSDRDCHFCYACLGGVFTEDQVEQMSNGVGLPVSYCCGGWNCRHSWRPVALDWRDYDDVRTKIETPSTIQLDPDAEVVMQVFCQPDTVEEVRSHIREEWSGLYGR